MTIKSISISAFYKDTLIPIHPAIGELEKGNASSRLALSIPGKPEVQQDTVSKSAQDRSGGLSENKYISVPIH